jgi:putative ABC transport system permease protein
VTPEYFDVLGMQLIAGRPLQASDTGWNAVVINDTLAQRFWGATPAAAIVGQSLTANGAPATVVGVVRSTRDRRLDRAPGPRIYKTLESSPLRRVSYAIRLSGTELPEAAIRRAVVSAHARALVDEIDSVSGRLAGTIKERSFATLMFTLFATAALGVTATGVFALVAFVAARRTHEIAVRMALGAEPRHIMRVVLRSAVSASLLGAVSGLLAGHAIVRLLGSQLYGVEPGDPATLAVAVATLIVIATTAASWPTRRALSIDPASNLRKD